MKPHHLPRLLLPLALALALATLAPLAPGQDPPKARSSPAPKATSPLESGPTVRLIRVVDGDTIVVDLDGRPTTIRLIGVDAPETVAPGKPVERGGKQAAAFLRDQLKGGSVRLEFEAARRRVDSYERILAYVHTALLPWQL